MPKVRRKGWEEDPSVCSLPGLVQFAEEAITMEYEAHQLPVENQMLNRFRVENYKCLREVEFPLTPIHVLIGQNNAGKTSLLEAMYAFFRSSRMDLNESFSGHWLGQDLVYENASDPGLVGLEGSWSDIGSYGFAVEFPNLDSRSCQLTSEWLTPHDSAERQHLQSGRNHFTSTCRWRKEKNRLNELDVKVLEKLAPLLEGAHLYRFDPRQMAIPSDLSPSRRFRLDQDGFGLPGLLDDILGYDYQLFANIKNMFCRYFPQFRSVRIETEQGIRRDYRETGRHVASEVVGKGIHFETQAGTTIRAQQASDGAILFLGYLALANLPNPPRLLLIEEPETGIYPERLEQVIELLRIITGEAGGQAPQIVFTTHSPYVLTSFQPEEVTFMSRGEDNSVRARPLRNAPHIQERLAGFYLGELWYNLSEAEIFADA